MRFHWMLLSLVSSFSFQVGASQVPPSREASFQAFKNLKRALTQHFHLSEQKLSLPETTLTSTTCEIRIKDVSAYGDRLMIEASAGSNNWVMSVLAGEPSEFSQGNEQFNFKAFTQDCEEQGCDGDWYVSRSMTISERAFTVFHTEPYSRKTFVFTCDLLLPLKHVSRLAE